MNVNSNYVLKNFDDSLIEVDQKGGFLFLKKVLIDSLCYEDTEIKPTPEQKMRAYDLCMKLTSEEVVELLSEDIVFIKVRLLKLYNALIYGQVVKLLEDSTNSTLI